MLTIGTFISKLFFFSIELFWSPPGMNGESIKSNDNWLYVWYTKKRHCDLPDPASITAGLSALLLVVDDCARISISPGYSATVMAHDKDETSARPCLNADRTWALSKLQRLNLSTPWLIQMPPAFQKTWFYRSRVDLQSCVTFRLQQSDSVIHMRVSGASQVH